MIVDWPSRWARWRRRNRRTVAVDVAGTVVIGFRAVSETSCTVCGGNYLSLEWLDGGWWFRCWCGATAQVVFASAAELDSFLARYQA